MTQNIFMNASKAISKDEIKEIERKLEITLPEQLVKHYLKYNGGAPIRNFLFSRISDIETSIQTFLPMKYKDATGFSLEEMYLNFVEKKVFSKKFLPFAIDYGGNLFCVNLEDKKIVMIWLDIGDVDENRIPILSNNFSELLNSLEEVDE